LQLPGGRTIGAFFWPRNGPEKWQQCKGPSPANKSLRGELEFEVAGRAREGDNVAYVGDAGQHHEQPLETQTKTCVRGGAKAAQVHVPPVVFGVLPQLLDAGRQAVQAFLALRTADKFADARHQHVHGGDGFAVFVLAHVKALISLG